MAMRYSYDWFIRQFNQAKDTAEDFLLSVEEAYFLKRPAEHQWCIAESYQHLIKFGYIYHQNIASHLSGNNTRTDSADKAFPPRWFWKKVADYFEPPYRLRLKTISSMEPDITADYNRREVLDEFMNLQDYFIVQLKEAKNKQIDLSGTKIPHPVVTLLKLTFPEYYQLTLAHQRRHQWQAEQTLLALKKEDGKADSGRR